MNVDPLGEGAAVGMAGLRSDDAGRLLIGRHRRDHRRRNSVGCGLTNGGTLAVHASLVAREYGILAVVATGDATARRADGQVVTVNGGAGTFELHR